MTPEALAAIQARVEAATPGPWAWGGYIGRPVLWQDFGNHVYVMRFVRSGMQGAEPEVLDYRNPNEQPPLVPSREFAVREASYRDNVAFYDQPDMQFMAHAREDIPALLEALRKSEADNARLRGALTRAKDDMAGWGSYASQYFRDKWHLADDLAAIVAALAEPSAEGGQA